jgi:hypothetical protein
MLSSRSVVYCAAGAIEESARRPPGKNERLALKNGAGMIALVKRNLLWPSLLMVAVFWLSRWPGLMPPNFSAAYALVFCAGLYIPGAAGWIGPLAALAISDGLITPIFYHLHDFSWGRFLVDQSPNYLLYAGLIGLGRWLGGKRPWWLLVGGGMCGAALFYLVTNTFSWLTLSYSKTFSGWIQALTQGMPGYPPTWEFFRNTLMSGGLFTGLFVGSMKMTENSEAQEEEEAEKETPPADGEPSEAEIKA